MSLKKLTFAFFPFFLCLFVNSQTPHDLNHRRYWFYRTRFINDFVKIGNQQGDCICFPQRDLGGPNISQAKVGPDQIDQMNMYLAALALEFKILSRSNQDTKGTIKEIYYILETYNRLDEEADQFWDNPDPTFDNPISRIVNDRNGFMLREDMYHEYFNPNTHQDNFLHFNYALKEYTNIAQSMSQAGYSGLTGIDHLTNDNQFSNWEGFGQPPNFTQPKEKLPIVHDKYYSMFFAFMLLVKYIPDNLTYIESNVSQQFSDGETKIKQEVRNITNRCHPYLRGNTFASNASDWIMEFADGSNLDPIVLGTPVPFFLYPLVNTICHINNSFPWNTPCLGFADIISLHPNSIGAYQLINSSTAVNEDNAVFLAYNHSSSNVNVGPVPLWLKMQQNTTFWDLEWADLARKVLHQNGVLTKQNSVYETPLSQANCWGPFNFGNCNHAGCEWSATDRIEHPKRRSAGCASTTGCLPQIQIPLASVDFPANYPGVDYMLLHNLYYEHLNQKFDNNQSESGAYINAKNLMDNYDEKIWPRMTTSGIGNNQKTVLVGVDSETIITNTFPPSNNSYTTTSPGREKFFQNLTSRAQIYATSSPWAPLNTIPSKVEYRAGKDITLLPEDPTTNAPGFEVKAGSTFHAYIQRYVCGQSDYSNGMKQANNTEEVHNTDYESDYMDTEIPIHYVEYPELSDADKYPVLPQDEDYTNYDPNTTKELDELLIEQTNTKNSISNSEWENTQRFEILPNPSTGIFKVIANKIDTEEVLSLLVIDMKGNTVYWESDFKTNEIDLSKLAKGIYMIQLKSSIGKTYSKRVSLIE